MYGRYNDRKIPIDLWKYHTWKQSLSVTPAPIPIKTELSNSYILYLLDYTHDRPIESRMEEKYSSGTMTHTLIGLSRWRRYNSEENDKTTFFEKPNASEQELKTILDGANERKVKKQSKKEEGGAAAAAAAHVTDGSGFWQWTERKRKPNNLERPKKLRERETTL